MSTQPVATEQDARTLIEALDRRCAHVETDFEGARIRWRRIGEGRPLVLVHGGNGGWLHWVRNIAALAASHQLLLPDLPGCGESDAMPPPPSLERLVAAMARSIDQLVGAGTDIDLAAFSFGSVVSSNLAVARGHVRKLALMGATGHGQPRGALALRNWRTLAPGHAQDEAHWHNLATLMIHDRAALDALALVVHRAASERTRLRSKALSHTQATRDALDRLRIPVLLVWGEHDPTAGGTATAQVLTQGHPERRAHIIQGAGHWVQYERAEEINALLADWFA